MRKVCIALLLTIFSATLVIAQSEPKLDANTLKAIEASTPAMLPQEPIVPKERTDAEDEGLKGNVKSITGESQDPSGTASVEGRHFSYIVNYDEKGNFVKRISFDNRGNPSDITIYGYLNCARVSKISSIRNDYDPPPAMMPPGAARKGGQKPRDMRISYSFGYKYHDGKLAEKQMYYNDGKPGMRYTYSRTGKILEKLAFDDKDKLNQKYIYKLDEKGNEIEDVRIDLTPQRYYGDQKFVFKYDSFDHKGNWTKRIASQIIIVNGKEIAKPAFMHFRTITYFK